VVVWDFVAVEVVVVFVKFAIAFAMFEMLNIFNVS
jgi:hypothetical protein